MPGNRPGPALVIPRLPCRVPGIPSLADRRARACTAASAMESASIGVSSPSRSTSTKGVSAVLSSGVSIRENPASVRAVIFTSSSSSAEAGANNSRSSKTIGLHSTTSPVSSRTRVFISEWKIALPLASKALVCHSQRQLICRRPMPLVTASEIRVSASFDLSILIENCFIACFFSAVIAVVLFICSTRSRPD